MKSGTNVSAVYWGVVPRFIRMQTPLLKYCMPALLTYLLTNDGSLNYFSSSSWQCRAKTNPCSENGVFSVTTQFAISIVQIFQICPSIKHEITLPRRRGFPSLAIHIQIKLQFLQLNLNCDFRN